MEEIKIGDQIWSGKNLDVDTFRNGDPIPHVENGEQWEEAGENGTPAWCYYDNDPANGAVYGKLYNWHAVNDPRGLAPEGWHVPSDDEWTSLFYNYLGGVDVAGTKMKSSSGWDDDGKGTNESGFAGLPGGFRSEDGSFYFVGETGNWWSSTEDDTSDAWFHSLGYDYGDVIRSYGYKQSGFSVRCLRD
jgi:uncharacterized protein (TIGR02145 family)